LRRSLDRLKALVPLGANETRHTTLGLLENAQTFIRVRIALWQLTSLTVVVVSVMYLTVVDLN